MINVSWLFFIVIGWMFKLDEVILQSNNKVDFVMAVAAIVGFGVMILNRKTAPNKEAKKV